MNSENTFNVKVKTLNSYFHFISLYKVTTTMIPRQFKYKLFRNVL